MNGEAKVIFVIKTTLVLGLFAHPQEVWVLQF
jgi:hypothetical protein